MCFFLWKPGGGTLASTRAYLPVLVRTTVIISCTEIPGESESAGVSKWRTKSRGAAFDPTFGGTNRRLAIRIAEARPAVPIALFAFPGMKRCAAGGDSVCQYENYVGSQFLFIDRHPSNGSVWIVGGGSGHRGFKHGPGAGGKWWGGWCLKDDMGGIGVFKLERFLRGTRKRIDLKAPEWRPTIAPAFQTPGKTKITKTIESRRDGMPSRAQGRGSVVASGKLGLFYTWKSPPTETGRGLLSTGPPPGTGFGRVCVLSGRTPFSRGPRRTVSVGGPFRLRSRVTVFLFATALLFHPQFSCDDLRGNHSALSFGCALLGFVVYVVEAQKRLP